MEQLVVPSSLAASSSPHLPCHRRHAAPSPCRRLQAVGGFGCARPESTGVAVNFRTPQFKLLEPLTEKLWTLNDFEGNPALQVEAAWTLTKISSDTSESAKVVVIWWRVVLCPSLSIS